jgi:heme/copper-type cytochrome/quinol oxidase subunit 2
MKTWITFLIIVGILLIIVGMLLFTFCYMVSDPEIEGDSGRTGLGSYLLTLIPVAIGILLLILSSRMKKNKASTKP